MKRLINNQSGSALAMTLIIMLVLMVLGTALLNVSVAENKFVNSNEDKLQSYYIARSGAQSVAEYMVEDHNNDAKNMIGKTSNANTQVGGGSFTVSVIQDPSNSSIVNITSIGSYNGINQTSKIQVFKTSTGVGGLFNHALVAQGDIDAASNGGAGIDIDGSIVTINGAIDSTLTNHYKAQGSGQDSTITLPEIVYPSNMIELGTINLSNGGNGGGNGNGNGNNAPTYDLVLPRNSDTPSEIKNNIRIYNYHVSSISLQNAAIGVIDNSGLPKTENKPNVVVHIYVDGNISMATNSMLTAEANTLLYVYCKGTAVSLSGSGENNNIYIYAPDADITWQNAQNHNMLYGGLVGNTITIANQIDIKYNPYLANYSNLDTTNVGVNFTGYKWID